MPLDAFLLLFLRLTLAGVFAIAGAATLADRAGSRRALTGFGVPDRLTASLAVGLPIAELAVAAALFTRDLAWAGAVGAALLLAVFVVAIALNMARGRATDCHCFGQLHSKPAGRPTLVRNGVLLTMALILA